MIPACRHAPPKAILSRRASRMNSTSPASTDPIGAPRPFDRLSISASACIAYATTVAPVTVHALNSRAPSR
jgi:hypothetical protein